MSMLQVTLSTRRETRCPHCRRPVVTYRTKHGDLTTFVEGAKPHEQQSLFGPPEYGLVDAFAQHQCGQRRGYMVGRRGGTA